MLEMLTESGQMLPLLGSVLLTALLCSVTERMEKCGIYIRCGVAAATAGGLFLLYRQILDGFALYWNTVADTFGSRAGIYFTRFDTADIMAEDTARLVFLIYLGMAAAVIGFLILRFRIYVLVFLEIFVLPFMMVLTGKEPESGVGVAFYMGIFWRAIIFWPVPVESDTANRAQGLLVWRHPYVSGTHGSRSLSGTDHAGGRLCSFGTCCRSKAGSPECGE